MNFRKTPRLILLSLFAASNLPFAEEGSSEFDAFLKAYTAAWNSHDGEALAAFFTADADLIMGNLPRVSGREAIGEWWRTYFFRLDEGRKGAFELLSLRDIAPEVTLANVRSKTFGVSRHGKGLETRLARGTWVVVKSHGEWQIAAMRGFPAEGEQRERPGTDR